jgi:ABC-2 type transport system permease protein
LYKYFCICIHRFDRIFDLFFWPLIDIFMWGFASSFINATSNNDVNFVTLFLGGLIFWNFVWSNTRDLSLFILEDYWGRNLYNQYASPLTSKELIVSLVTWALLRNIISILVLAGLAYVIHAFNFFSIPILPMLAFASILVLFGWAMGLLLGALIFRFGMRIQVLTWSLSAMLMPFSCVLYPLSSLPSWAHSIAVLLPTTHIFEGFRTLMFTGVFDTSKLGYSLIVTLVVICVTISLFKVSIDSARKRGDFTRYA